MANWRQLSSGSSKPSTSTGLTKRHLSLDSSSGDTNNNPSGSQWFQSSFNDNNPYITSNNNSKRAKTDVGLNSADLSSVTTGLNQLTTNGATQVDEEENPFDDDLDDFLTQASFVPGKGFTLTQAATGLCLPADNVPPMTVQLNPNDQTSREVLEGRVKILESKNKQLMEELSRQRAQTLISNKKMTEVTTTNQNQLDLLRQKYDTDVQFLQSENVTQKDMIELMQNTLNKLGPFQLIHVFVKIMSTHTKSNAFAPHKLKEFYRALEAGPPPGTLTAIQSQLSQFATGGSFFVPDSQRSSSLSAVNMPSQVGPTQIGPTQLSQSPMSISVAHTASTELESMDTTSIPQSNHSTITSQVSQSQHKRSFWTDLQTILENKFSTNRRTLDELLMEQQLPTFDVQFVHNTQELNQLSASLSELSLRMGVSIVSF